MIARLHGTLIEKTPPWLLIDVGGVGYQCQAPMSTFYHLPNCQNEVILFTTMIIREDNQALYGFLTKEERQLFQDFIKINGIGGKAALALLSGMSPEALKMTISTADVNRLKKIPGIGPKTAQRIIVELQDKQKKWELTSLGALSDDTNQIIVNGSEQAIEALISLGYKNKEAERAIQSIEDRTLSCEDMIKLALQGLAKV